MLRDVWNLHVKCTQALSWRKFDSAMSASGQKRMFMPVLAPLASRTWSPGGTQGNAMSTSKSGAQAVLPEVLGRGTKAASLTASRSS